MPKIAKSISEDLSTLTIEINEGETLEFNLNDYSPEIQAHLAAHGLSQKLGDSVARKDIDTPEAIAETINSVHEKLVEGNWRAVREATGGAPRTTLLAEALAHMTGKTVDEAKEVVAQLSDDQKKALRKDVNVKAAIDQVKAAKSAKEAEAGGGLDIKSLFSAPQAEAATA